MSNPDSEQYDLLDQLAEEFADRLRRGERPALKEYTDRYPELADDIRELFPALVKVERVEVVRQGDEKMESGESRSANPPPLQISDYRILLEIGRGGMGVVYEAEQVSLGRRVALKVLTGHVSSDRVAQERFRREARAAAKLHHTNIVPVFEVGQDADARYYAMQFIQGQGLDLVIAELRRLRDRARSEPTIRAASEDQSHRARGEHARQSYEDSTLAEGVEVSAVLRSILSGQFDPGGPGPELVGDSSTMLAKALAGGLGEPTETGAESCAALFDPAQARTEIESANAVARSDLRQPHPPAFDLGPSASPSSSSAILPGGVQLSSVESGRRGFFRSLAHIGRQVAGGLAYAHARGIVHRDIKPSNLLLDTEGVVWIADFGLAKGEDKGLTQSGDILGTLHYMAPERFRGEGDACADVYALGLTLYELLTLRSAFDSSDRLKLIEQIKTKEPPKPRSLDTRIPRDLETIVLKAIEKDPLARYQTAEMMGEDLRRFLADEPIRARQVSAAERARRWCRRNPGLAIATSLSVLALVATAVIALAYAVQQGRFARQQTLAAGRELSLRQTAEGLLARVALKEGVNRCEQSAVGHGLLWMTRALEYAGADQPDLQREIRLNIDRWSRAAPHLRYAKEFLQRVNAVAVSPDGARALAGSEDCTAQLWELASGRPIATALRHAGPVSAVAFSPDGSLALTAARDGRAWLWKADTGQEARPALFHGGPIETAGRSRPAVAMVRSVFGIRRVWISGWRL